VRFGFDVQIEVEVRATAPGRVCAVLKLAVGWFISHVWATVGNAVLKGLAARLGLAQGFALRYRL
jgi:hypothetical protein